MLKWLAAAGGVELALIGVLSGALIFGAGAYKGKQWEQAAEAQRQLDQEKALDGKSETISIETGQIVDDLTDKIGRRMAGQSQANTKAIEESAKAVGRLEGEADGYLRGFKDAEEKLKNTCFTDPAFLSDGMRRDAESRYGAIFGGQSASQGASSTPDLLSGSVNNAPSQPPN